MKGSHYEFDEAKWYHWINLNMNVLKKKQVLLLKLYTNYKYLYKLYSSHKYLQKI